MERRKEEKRGEKSRKEEKRGEKRRKEEKRGEKRRKEEKRGEKRRKEEKRGGKRRKEEKRGEKRSYKCSPGCIFDMEMLCKDSNWDAPWENSGINTTIPMNDNSTNTSR